MRRRGSSTGKGAGWPTRVADSVGMSQRSMVASTNSSMVIVPSLGRPWFDSALTPLERSNQGLPSEGTMTMDEFVDATIDLWDIPTESATRVGHPAPFPVELPRRLIELYTYRGDLVMDPFMGSG